MILAVALGNNTLRLALLDQGRMVERRHFPLAGVPVKPETFAGFTSVEGILVASVHPVLLPRLEAALAGLGKPVRVAGRDFRIPLANRYRRPEETGIDRLLGVLAAGHHFPGEGVVVVDFGTALTVNAGSPQGEFLGGWIGIGASTAAAALCQAAPRLPPLELAPPQGGLAGDTRTAINDGVIWQAAGGVERLLKELGKSLPWPFRVVATGGDAPLVVPHLAGIDLVEPDLVLEGLWLAYEKSRPESSAAGR
ncbi:MAG: type III pantothenate kinase [Planctomycetes bacterium]|nr:type III pantothenate kinase [Planctomycetota bacterium]